MFFIVFICCLYYIATDSPWIMSSNKSRQISDTAKWPNNLKEHWHCVFIYFYKILTFYQNKMPFSSLAVLTTKNEPYGKEKTAQMNNSAQQFSKFQLKNQIYCYQKLSHKYGTVVQSYGGHSCAILVSVPLEQCTCNNS